MYIFTCVTDFVNTVFDLSGYHAKKLQWIDFCLNYKINNKVRVNKFNQLSLTLPKVGRI